MLSVSKLQALQEAIRLVAKWKETLGIRKFFNSFRISTQEECGFSVTKYFVVVRRCQA